MPLSSSSVTEAPKKTRWRSDGGSLTFAALFGWLIALFYAAPWFILFLVATSLRGVARRFRKEKG